MARAERIMSLADRLRGSAETTVDALAAELGVSSRTVRRDLAMLRDRGMPIAGQAGPGGGIRLEGHRGVTSVHLATGEVVALWLAARLAQATAEVPWSRRADSALAKMLASLPKQRARELRELSERIFVGPPASANLRAGAGVAPPELLRLFEEATTTGLGLAFRYQDREGRESMRRIEPHGLLVQPPVWYMLARDADRDAARSFRMDRVSAPVLVRSMRFVPDRRVVRALLTDDVAWYPLRATASRSAPPAREADPPAPASPGS